MRNSAKIAGWTVLGLIIVVGLVVFTRIEPEEWARVRRELRRTPGAPFDPAKTVSRCITAVQHGLEEDAWTTYSIWFQGVNRGVFKRGEDIPPECWVGRVKAVKPLRVYEHGLNMVIVRKIVDGVEEGKYIYLGLSSRHPKSGDDGFEFLPNPDDGKFYTLPAGGFEFRRPVGAARKAP